MFSNGEANNTEGISEVASREIGLSETGAKISFATSHHEEFSPENIVNKQSTKPWLTGGMYPQIIIVSFPALMDVKEIDIKSYNAKSVAIEKSETGIRLDDFEAVTENLKLEQTKGYCQKEQLSNYTFAAMHIKLTIFAGHDKFCAVFRLGITGGFSSKPAGPFGAAPNPPSGAGLFSFGQQQQQAIQQQQQQAVDQQQFAFGNSALFAQPERQAKPSLFFGKKVEEETNNSADDESEEEDNTAPASPAYKASSPTYQAPTSQEPFVSSKMKVVSQGDGELPMDNMIDHRAAAETPTRETASDSDQEETEGRMWNALGGLDSPKYTDGAEAEPAAVSGFDQDQLDDDPIADLRRGEAEALEGDGFLSDDVTSTGEMNLPQESTDMGLVLDGEDSALKEKTEEPEDPEQPEEPEQPGIDLSDGDEQDNELPF